MAELAATARVLAAAGCRLGGVHFELSGEPGVTECVGGPHGLCTADLPRGYSTACDPRLNYAQAMELAFLLAGLLRRDAQPPGGPESPQGTSAIE